MCSNKNQKLTQELLKNAGERVAKYQSDKATRRFGVKAEPSCSQYDMQLAQFAVDIRSKIYCEAQKILSDVNEKLRVQEIRLWEYENSVKQAVGPAYRNSIYYVAREIHQIKESLYIWSDFAQERPEF